MKVSWLKVFIVEIILNTDTVQAKGSVFWRVRKVAKSNYYLRHICLFICPSFTLALMEQLGSH